MQVPRAVTIVEVGPRDGFQLVGHVIPTATKLRIIRSLYEAGVRDMEVTSFVSPNAVPQFADADDVAREALRLPGLRASALVPNLRGLERALAAGIRAVTVVIGATDAFNSANVRMTVSRSLEQLAAIAEAARAVSGVSLEAGIAVAFGCPYSGSVPLDAVEAIVERAVALGITSVSLGDTIGVATPAQVAGAVTRLATAYPGVDLALHLHDTRGMGLANVLAGMDAGVTTFDAAIGGLGGCPFAPGATGNIATDDTNHMLRGMGVDTGIDQNGLLAAGRLVAETVTPDLPSHAFRVYLSQTSSAS
ncbi:MAG TPA: hydroxymethylglutaryl-CoA lyase [bacterium]|nr:hydroxymethylglutaryl-CoA lyase [bacterium]